MLAEVLILGCRISRGSSWGGNGVRWEMRCNAVLKRYTRHLCNIRRYITVSIIMCGAHDK